MSLTEELAKIDALFDAIKFEEENSLLLKLEEQNPNEVEIIWRLSRSYFNIDEMQKNSGKSKKIFR